MIPLGLARLDPEAFAAAPCGEFAARRCDWEHMRGIRREDTWEKGGVIG